MFLEEVGQYILDQFTEDDLWMHRAEHVTKYVAHKTDLQYVNVSLNSNKDKRWSDTMTDAIKAFNALCITLSHVKNHTLYAYWSSNLFPSIMPFMQLNYCIKLLQTMLHLGLQTVLTK